MVSESSMYSPTVWWKSRWAISERLWTLKWKRGGGDPEIPWLPSGLESEVEPHGRADMICRRR